MVILASREQHRRPEIVPGLSERRRSIWTLDDEERLRGLPKRPRRLETGQSPYGR